MGLYGRVLGKTRPWRRVRYRTFLGAAPRAWGTRGTGDPDLAGALTPHCPSFSPFSRALTQDLPLPFHHIQTSRDRAFFHLLWHLSLTEPPDEGRAGQGREDGARSTAGKLRLRRSNASCKVILAKRWQSCYWKPRLWTPSPVLV